MAERNLLLGLDAGNTVIKAVLFDTSGRQLALSKRDGASSTPAPGHVERDLNELWANAATVIRECIERAGVSADAIAAIGCAGHGNGLYLIDGAGDPLIGIQSLDSRAAQMAEELGANGNAEKLHALCMQSPWPSQTPTLLAWVRRHAPDIYARTATAFYCKDFVTFRLTGRRVSDISDMSGAGFIRLPECTYDDELLAGYGLEDARSKLPELVDPTEIVGRVTRQAATATGLAEGTPVIGGLFDVIASALGSSAVENGQASIIVGTWSINQVIADRLTDDPRIFMTSIFGRDRVMAIESSATSAANLEWYVREFIERGGHVDDPFLIANSRAGGIAPAVDDPYYHPYLYGSRLGATMRAGFYGVAGWHGEGHLLRALFEGIAFEHRRHIDVLRSAGIRFDSAILSGGGARSPIWPQMFADILGMPISVASCAETGALGAALAAGVGAGLFSDLGAGVRAMTRTGQSFAARPDLGEHYDARYRTFGQIREAMKPIWASVTDASRNRS
ncbi:MAG: FGGY-family carbohydrate kinase [Devosia sp.]